MATGLYIHLLIYRKRSGSEPGPKEAVITETAERKCIAESDLFPLLDMKHKGWVTATAWGVF